MAKGVKRRRYSGVRMNYDALSRIEDALSQLGLKDSRGGLVDPVAAMGVVALHLGPSWDALFGEWVDGTISSEEYYDRSITLINQYADEKDLPRPNTNRTA